MIPSDNGLPKIPEASQIPGLIAASLEAPGEAKAVGELAQPLLETEVKVIEAWDLEAEHLQLDNAKFEEIVAYVQDPELASVKTFFQILRDFIFRIGLFLGFVKARDEGLNFRILSQITRASPDLLFCPPSLLLSYTYEYVKRKNGLAIEVTKEDQELEKKLADAASWTKRIEELQKKKELQPNSRELQDVIANIRIRLVEIDSGEKVLIPGGWQTEHGVSEALYEVEKINEDKFNIRMLSLAEENKEFWRGEKNLETGKIKYNPVLEFHDVTAQQLEDSIEPLVLIQLPQLYQSKDKTKGWLARHTDAVQTLLFDKDTSSKGYISPLDVMHTIYGQAPQAPAENDVLVTVPKTRNFAKTLLTYIESVNPKQYKVFKVKLELAAFFKCVNEDSQAFLKNQTHRDLVRTAARKMMVELEKNKDKIGLTTDEFNTIVEELEKVIVQAKELDKKSEKWKIPELQLSPLEKSFKLRAPAHPESLSTVHAEKARSRAVTFKKVAFPAAEAATPGAATQSLADFQARMKVIQGLYNKEDYATMDALLLDLIRQLPSPDVNQDFWSAVHADDVEGELQAWTDAMHDLSQYLFDSQHAQGLSTSPDRVIANATLLAVSDRLMVLADAADTKVAGRTIFFDPSEMRKVLRDDPYFRAISPAEHSRVQDVLKYWDDVEPSRALIRMGEVSHFKAYAEIRNQGWKHSNLDLSDIKELAYRTYIERHGSNEYEYLSHLAKVKDKEMSEAYFEFEVSAEAKKPTILPPSFIQQRKMHIIMQSMLTNQHSFALSDVKGILAQGMELVADMGGESWSQQKMWQYLFSIQDRDVKKRLQTHRPGMVGKQRQHIKFFAIGGRKSIHLYPSDVRINNEIYNYWKQSHPGQNKEFYRDEGRHLDQEDEQVAHFTLGVRNVGEEILTQQTVVSRSKSEREKLLKSMQSGDSRLEQTFATFRDHPELLDTTSTQRLFELNMFKQGELLRKIQEQPGFAQELLVFAQNNYELSLGVSNFQKAIFFLQLRSHLLGYIELARTEEIVDALDKITGEFLETRLGTTQEGCAQHTLTAYTKLLDHFQDKTQRHEQRAVYVGLMLEYLRQLEERSLRLDQLEDDDLTKIVNGYFLFKSYDPGIAEQNPAVDRKILQLMARVRPKLKQMFSVPGSAQFALASLNEILANPIDPFHIQGTFPKITAGNQVIDLERGLVFVGNKAKGLLPNDIRDNELVKRLFTSPKTKQLTLRDPEVEFKIDPKTGQEVTVYTFPNQPNVRMLKQEGQDLIIQRKMYSQQTPGFFESAKWYQILPFADPRIGDENKDYQLPGELSDLVLDKLVWQEVGDPSHLVVLDDKTKTANGENSYLYNVHLVKTENKEAWQLKEVRRFKDDLILVNPWKAHADLGSLTAIEDHSHIKAWGRNANEAIFFEFPRMKMSGGDRLAYRTTWVKNKGTWIKALESVQYPGYFLPFKVSSLIIPVQKDNEAHLADVLPPMFRNFHVLYDPKKPKQRKVIIPFQSSMRPGEQPVAKGDTAEQQMGLDEERARALSKYAKWSDETRLDHNAKSWNSQSLMEFDIDSINGKIKMPDDKQKALYLAYLFFTNKDYTQAVEFFENGLKTSDEMRDSHLNIFNWIEKWADETPEGIAFKLKAALAAKKYKLDNKRQSVEQSMLEFKQIHDLYLKYEAVKPKLTGEPNLLQLTAEEEELYIRIMAQSFAPLEGLKPLDSKVAPIEATEWKKSADMQEVDFDLVVKQVYVEMGGGKYTPEMLKDLTADEPFIQNFRGLYEAIYDVDVDTDHYRKLKHFVEIAKPKSGIAKITQGLLQYLIKQKEISKAFPSHKKRQWHFKSGLPFLKFPSAISPSYFTLKRMAATQVADDDFKLFNEFLNTLKAESEKGVGREQEPVVPKEIPKREKEISRAGYFQMANPDEAEQKLRGEVDLKLQKEGINLREKGNDPDVVMKKLHEMGEMEKLAQARRVSGLADERNKLISKLLWIKAQPKVTKPKVEPTKPEPVMNMDVSPFINVKVEPQLAEQSDASSRFFESYIGEDSGVAPSVRRLAGKFKEDTEAFCKEKKNVTMTLEAPPGYARLKHDMKVAVIANRDAIAQEKQRLEKSILDLIYKPKALTPQQAAAQIIREELVPTPKVIPQRLIGLYVDDADWQEVNKRLGLNLTEAEVEQLKENMGRWMDYSIKERSAESAVETIVKLKKQDLSKLSSEAIQELHQSLAPMRYFSEADEHYRELLAIEFKTPFILRANQVDTINAMLSDPNQVKQLGMGQGKSSVLLPMMLHRLADGTRLAMGILPEWLANIVAAELDVSSNKIFGQKTFPFKFDRNVPLTREWLLKHYNLLAECILKKNAILTTKTDLLSFRNKFLELQIDFEKASGSQRKELRENIKIMSDILMIFKNSAAIADEVDSILDTRKELNYALGLPSKIDPKKYDMGLRVFKKLLQSSDVQLEEYKQKLLNNEQGLLTAADHKVIQHQLATEFFDEWHNQLDVDEELFTSYVQGDSDIPLVEGTGMPQFMLDLQRVNKPLFGEIAILLQYVSKTLPTTLSHSGDVHYGRAADGSSTIPYQGNNTPSQAEFGEEFERIGHFIQDYLQKGLTEKQVQVWVNRLLQKIQSEMIDEDGETIKSIDTSPTLVAFQKQFGLDPTKLSQDHEMLMEFLGTLNENSDTKLKFLEDWIFPTLEMADTQVSSNANDLVDMVGSFSGFTGTPWNVDTYHRKIHAEDAQAVGTDGKTVDLLIQMANENQLQIRSVKLNAADPLGSILESDGMEDFMDRYDSLIDAGYYLKGVNNGAVGRRIYDIRTKAGLGGKKAFVFIGKDEKGEDRKFIESFGKEDAQPLANRPDVKMGNRLTYYDEAHTIGTDIPHEQNARAALTIGEKMYVKDFFQAMWRMRKLDKGQKIDLIISEDVQKLIRGARSKAHLNPDDPEITISDVILFCIKNQAEREAEDNLRAERQKLTGFIPNVMFWQLVEAANSEILEGLAKPADPLEVLFPAYKEFLFKSLSGGYESLAKIGLPEDSVKVLNDLKNQLVKKYEGVRDNLKFLYPWDNYKIMLFPAITNLRDFKLLEADKLPATTEAAASDAKDSQVQTQRQQQQQISIESQTRVTPPDPNAIWNSWTPANLEELWDISETYEKAGTEDAIPFLDGDIRVTPNFAPKNSKMSNQTLAARMLGEKRIPVGQVLVMEDTLTHQTRVVLLDIKDYEETVANLIKPDSRYKAAVFDVRQKTLLLRSTEDQNVSPWEGPEMDKITKELVKLKVYSGQTTFRGHDKEVLTDWIKEPAAKKYLKLQNRILNPEQQKSYDTSTIRQLFTSNAA